MRASASATGNRGKKRSAGGSRVVLWLARGVSLPLFAFSLFWIVFVLDSPFASEPTNALTTAGVLLVPVCGVIVAWLSPRIGAVIMALGAVGVGALLYVRNIDSPEEIPLAFLLFCLPYLILAVLFLMASTSNRAR